MDLLGKAPKALEKSFQIKNHALTASVASTEESVLFFLIKKFSMEIDEIFLCL